MKKKGMMNSVKVSEFWPTFLRRSRSYLERMKLPSDILEIVKYDLPTKYGTPTLRRMMQSMPYEEVAIKSWENLVSGNRWIS